MSALQDTGAYTVRETSEGPFPFDLLDGAGKLVDRFRTRSAAEHASRILGLDSARVDAHALLGCRAIPTLIDGESIRVTVCGFCGGLLSSGACDAA